MRHPTYYTVIPTFSCGSPAQVSEAIALAVAKDEEKGYERARSGIYGEAVRLAAPVRSLYGIVYSWTETGRHGCVVRDLITGEVHTFKKFTEFQAWGTAQREATRRYINIEVNHLARTG